MQKIVDIASHISTPLGLAGIIVVILFFIIRAILSLGIFSKLSKTHTFSLIANVVNKLFIITLVAVLLGFISYIIPSFIKSDKTSEATQSSLSSTALYVKNGRFEPMPTFFLKNQNGIKNDFYETSFFHVKLLNISNSDIFITSIEVNDINHIGVLSPAYTTSGLGSDISRNTPFKIPAGQEVEIEYSGGIRFQGLVNSFNLQDLANEYYISDTTPKISSRTALIDELNHKLKSLFGKDAIINVKFYTNNKKLILEHDFNITNGTGIFDHNGQIQHSYFLGDLIYWLNSSFSKDVIKQKKSTIS